MGIGAADGETSPSTGGDMMSTVQSDQKQGGNSVVNPSTKKKEAPNTEISVNNSSGGGLTKAQIARQTRKDFLSKMENSIKNIETNI